MTKRIRVIFFLALAYFILIIPVQSQQSGLQEQLDYSFLSGSNETTETEADLEADFWLPRTWENNWEYIQENLINDTGQKDQNQENYYESNIIPQDDINESGDNFTNDTTWQNDQINQVPQLIISEIYFDWTEEWIEIINLGSDFSGELQISFPSIVNISLFMGSGEVLIVSKSSKEYSWLSPLVRQISTPSSFSITDSKAIDIYLFRSGQILDNFYAETGLVNSFDNKKTSLIKQYNNQIWFITGSNSAINVLDPYIASPGFYENLYISESWSTINNPTTWNNQTWTSEIITWSDLGGEWMSGIVETPTPTSPQLNILSITEIFAWNWQFSPFIELKAHQDFSGKIILTGSLLKTALELDFVLEKNEYIIIVYIDNLWLSDQKKIEKPSLELNNSWFLYLLGQSGQVFDIVQLLSLSWNKSFYNWGFSSWNIDIFSKNDTFSPWFDEKYLVYSRLDFQISTWQNDQNSWSSDQIGSGGLSTGWTQNWQDLSWTSNTGIIIQAKNLQITSLNQFNPESIKIQSNLFFNINLSSKDRYLLTKETKTSNRKTTKKYLTWILNSGESIIISKTRWFLDKWSCVGIFYQTNQIDERCYWSALNSEIVEEKEIEIDDDQETTPNIVIIWVLPNPVGKDDKEEIYLLRIPDSWQNDQNLILSNKSLYLKINTSKKYLTWTFYSNKEKIFIWSLGLVNKAACIEIRYKTNLLDNYCYPEPKEGQYLQKGKEDIQDETWIIQEIPNISIQWLMPNPKGKDDQEIISLFRTPNTWAIISGNQTIQSFNLSPKTLYILNNKSKTYLSGTLNANTGTIFKWSLGLVNKANCIELRYSGAQLDRFCYSNPKEDQYFGTWNSILQTINNSDFNILQKVWFIVTGSQICVNYYDQILVCRSLPASKTSIKLKNENKLYKTYFALFQNYLMKNRSTLYYNTDVKTYFDTFKQAKSSVSKFVQTISISGQQFNAYDLSGQIEFTTNNDKWEKLIIKDKNLRKRFLLRFWL